ncbi:tetratricopeptide repeat protein [Parabacteroides sp. OttesenSCG-928-G07]|nr:tetratricopeptide repeat protein [Parabacteroides sp. OttesenSCG-928-G21]MDL2278173.1 tetratricopeptide repeat protein [Parabacteroides sp. OttesenSCG-928-G07]
MNLTYLKKQLDKSKITFLAGAGISINSPSNLPAAKNYMLSMFKTLDQIAGWKQDLFQDLYYQYIEKQSKIRFEYLMALINQYFDSENHVLDIYALPKSPNEYHYGLANAIQNKNTVITVNFDVLIELACINRKMKVSQELFESDSVKEKKNTLYKLHGTALKLNDNGTWVRQLKESKSTLSSIGIDGYKFELFDSKRKFFEKKLKDSTLVVIGYSGLDDFDICPLIEEIKSGKKLVWIDFKNQDDVTYWSGDSLLRTNLPSPIKKILKNKRRTAENIILLQGRTLNILKRLFPLYFIPFNILYKSPEYNLDEYFRLVFKRIDFVANDAKFLYALLQEFLEITNISLLETVFADYKNQSYKKASQSGFHLAKRLNDENRFPEAIAVCEELVKLDAVHNKDFVPANLVLLAEIFKKQSSKNYDKALELYRQVINFPGIDRYTLAKACMGIGDLFQNRNLLKQAQGCFEKAYDMFQKMGYFLHASDCLQRMGTVEVDKQKFKKALSYFEQSMELKSRLGDERAIGRLKHEIGVLYNQKRDYAKAEKYLSEAIDIFRIVDDKHSLALALKELSVANYYLKKIDQAKENILHSMKYFKAAEQEYLYAHCLQVRGLIALTECDYNQSYLYLREAVEISKRYSDEVNVRNCLQTIQLVEKVSKVKLSVLDLQSLNDSWYNLGETLYNQFHNIPKAVEAYEKALELNPNDDMAWSSLGYMNQEKGQINEAIICHKTALRINPALQNSIYHLGNIYYEKKEYRQALEYCTLLSRYYPNDSDLQRKITDCRSRI